MALCGTASGATGLSRSTSCTRELRTGSLCLSLYFGYRPSSTVHSSSYTLVCTWRLKDRGERRSDCPLVCYFGVLREHVETCLWPVQEESHSPIQPGCSGLCPSDEKVHSGHVNVNIWQELGRPEKFIIKRRIYCTGKVDLPVHVEYLHVSVMHQLVDLIGWPIKRKHCAWHTNTRRGNQNSTNNMILSQYLGHNITLLRYWAIIRITSETFFNFFSPPHVKRVAHEQHHVGLLYYCTKSWACVCKIS